MKVFRTLDIFSQSATEKAVKIGILILKKKKN
jgi:hypothetical protein